jgi:hypothetical protein
MEPDTAVTRRRSLEVLGTGTLVALAGCTAARDRIPFVGDEEEELHEHGYLFVEIDGEGIDFSESKYVVEESDEPADEFHFHNYDEDARWHMHEVRLTLAQALDLLPDIEYAVEDGSPSLSVDGETYRDGANASIEVTEREEGEIEPESHHLRDGDVIEIVVETA